MKLKEYIFTFGANHTSCYGVSLGNRYCPIEAFSESQARALMFSARGNKWSHCYESMKDAGVDKWHLEIINLDEAICPLTETLHLEVVP